MFGVRGVNPDLNLRGFVGRVSVSVQTGAAERFQPSDFSRPFGTGSLGYSRMSLRDIPKREIRLVVAEHRPQSDLVEEWDVEALPPTSNQAIVVAQNKTRKNGGYNRLKRY